MIYVLKDLIRSKTMLVTMIFILGVSYIGGINNQNLNLDVKNNINVIDQVN